MSQMNDNLSQVRVILCGIIKQEETVDMLIDRVLSDNSLVTTICNICPNGYNVGVVEMLLRSQSFKDSLISHIGGNKCIKK